MNDKGELKKALTDLISAIYAGQGNSYRGELEIQIDSLTDIILHIIISLIYENK